MVQLLVADSLPEIEIPSQYPEARRSTAPLSLPHRSKYRGLKRARNLWNGLRPKPNGTGGGKGAIQLPVRGPASLHKLYTAIWTAVQPNQPPAGRASFLTPLNVLLVLVVVYVAYTTFFSSSSAATAGKLPAQPPPVVFKTFTPRTLLPFNGTEGKPVYLAVRGRVFDVSAGRNFYGPGGPYANFAGRDASRGLACGSFDESMLTKDLDGPLDKLEDLGAEEMEALRGWEERFEAKYLVVGRLVAAGEEGKK